MRHYTSPVLFAFLLLYSITAFATTYHVSVKGNDRDRGTRKRPLRTITAAAKLAMPGDTILVHQGIYREQVDPPRGGTAPGRRITYLAAHGEKVTITGSEQVKGWHRLSGDIWEVSIPNSFFGKFNPYNDLIHGDWFDDMDRQHHTGAVYFNGDWLPEAEKKEDVYITADKAMWFAEVNATYTTISARFKNADPNTGGIEINVRQKVFYPEKTGINYITVKGFTLCHAATNWAPPTAEQMALIGTNWSKGWIIEDNDISYSRCSGISLGKYGDQYDNTSANSAEGYVATIKRALANGWDKEHVGGHLIRNNTVSHCEQAGIVGSLGCAFSTVTGNTVHDIFVQRLFDGAEMAGIKFHGAIDVIISHNYIYHAQRGIWLDWMAQGTRVTRNILRDNDQDIFVEVDHGPYLVDNNFLLSAISVLDDSEGGAFVHNLVAGKIDRGLQDRLTPYFKPHSTILAGITAVKTGDMRYYNNIFLDADTVLNCYANTAPLLKAAGNIYMAKVWITTNGNKVWVQMDKTASPLPTLPVTAALLGNAMVPDLPFEDPYGKPAELDLDYFGRHRDNKHPVPGPIELKNGETGLISIWPVVPHFL